MKNLFIFLLLGFLFAAPAAFAEEMVQIKGSDTLINLVQRLAEVYMEKYPEKYIAVTGGGSGTGIAAMINGKCDIANSSREMKGQEIENAKGNSVDPKGIIVAIDGLTVITNAGNPVKQLTMDQVGAIFRGDITNWKEVGGEDMEINLYGRQSNSGTFIFFQEDVLKGDYSPKMKMMNGNAQIVEALKTDPSGIGYVGVGYLKQAPDLGVVKIAAEPGKEYYDPRVFADVESGLYPIARPLYQYVNGLAKGTIKEFIQFELGEEGQAIVVEEGFFPPSEAHKTLNAETGILSQ